MNKHLKTAVDRYPLQYLEDELNKGEPLKINPISQIDAEIMIEIMELIKKINGTSLLEILNDYKFLKDTEIRDKLMQLNLDVSKNQSENTGEQNLSVRYVCIQGSTIDLNQFISHNVYDLEENKELVYCLLLNPVHEKSKVFPMYANLEFIFDNEDERDRYADLLSNYLNETRGLFCDIEPLTKEDE
jgi:hypothetical protein